MRVGYCIRLDHKICRNRNNFAYNKKYHLEESYWLFRMEERELVQLILQLIERSDTHRANYSTRATLLFTAHTVLLGIIGFFFIESVNFIGRGTLALVLMSLTFVTAIMTITSFILAILASSSVRHSRIVTGYEGPKRLFLNPSETIAELADIKKFTSVLQSLSYTSFIESACGEFWVMLILQNRRYGYLRNAIWVLFGTLFFIIASVVVYGLLKTQIV